MECYIMHRKGVFEPDKYTSNQCKVEGHESYDYHIIMVFPGTQQLDINNFIVDHQDIDDTIQNMVLKGSCEEMHQRICDRLKKFFERKGIDLMAMKCIIKPVSQGGIAHMEYLFTRDSSFVPLISQMI